jgi:hypothetical protein
VKVEDEKLMITLRPKAKEPVTQNKKLEKLLAAKKRWEAKYKRADNAIKKLNKKIKYQLSKSKTK